MSTSEPKAAEPLRPLSGLKVLTIENFLAGPFASMWLYC